jgi:glycosyltransferase involved in cell wall biosynthesis
VVQDLSQKGGIQQFAKSQLSLSENADITNWANPTRLRDELIMGLLPNEKAANYFRRIHHGGIDKSIDLNKYALIIFWNVGAAMAFSELRNTVICCHGREILEANVKNSKRESFLYVIRNAKIIVANSAFTKRYLTEHYGIQQKNIKVINPGINLEKFKVNMSEKLDSIIKIGSLTRLVKRKNIINIVKALEILKNKYEVNFIYYLAGNGPERQHIIAALKKSGISYRYFGEITEKKKTDEFYPSLNIFVLPPVVTRDDVEGFGIVFLEANACGVPVVTSNTGGISDAIKDGISGLFTDPENPEDIAETIYKILVSKKKWKKLSRDWAETFSQKKTAKDFEILYREILNR